MGDLEIYVCNEKCTINRHLSSSSKSVFLGIRIERAELIWCSVLVQSAFRLLCVLPSGTVKDAGCSVRIVGRLGDYNEFTLNVKKTTHSIALMTDQAQHAKSSR